MSEIILLGQNFLALFVESAPWLLLGLLVAGIMHELVPVSFLEKHMGQLIVWLNYKGRGYWCAFTSVLLRRYPSGTWA